jgi:hypothetical protein
MNRQPIINTAIAYKSLRNDTLENNTVILKEAFVKPCKHRTETGFCTRSNRQCPAALFNLLVNK